MRCKTSPRSQEKVHFPSFYLFLPQGLICFFHNSYTAVLFVLDNQVSPLNMLMLPHVPSGLVLWPPACNNMDSDWRISKVIPCPKLSAFIFCSNRDASLLVIGNNPGERWCLFIERCVCSLRRARETLSRCNGLTNGPAPPLDLDLTWELYLEVITI